MVQHTAYTLLQNAKEEEFGCWNSLTNYLFVSLRSVQCRVRKCGAAGALSGQLTRMTALAGAAKLRWCGGNVW